MADNSIIQEAIDFLRLSSEAESLNRSNALEDLRFVNGEQWPTAYQQSRTLEGRPFLTINKLDGFCRQVSNQQRQQKPRIKIHPTNGLATKKIADVLTGLCRHIEVNSNADTAYDTAFDSAVKIGWGYLRLRTDYEREDSFNQEIYIDAIDNPFSVYFDPNSTLPDGSDAERAEITTVMSKIAFRKMYPDADDGANFNQTATGDGTSEWVTKEDIRVCEYYKLELKAQTLVKLSDGSTVWKDKMPDQGVIDRLNIKIVQERPSYRKQLKWYKLTAMEVLDEKELDGCHIPIVPVYGNVVVIDGKREKYGMVRFGKDPQRMINYWETAATESIALAPKAKWIMAEGQIEGHENDWNKANLSSQAVLQHKQTDINGEPAPRPERVQPEPPPVGILQCLQQATGNLREVLGVNDPAQRIQGNVSGKALISEKQQSDNSTFHYYDNFTRSVQQVAKIILGWVPTTYDMERMIRIIGEDGKPDLITINEKQTTAEGEIINNNLKVGSYDVVMDIGPGYNSKRQEAVEAMAPMMQNEELMQKVGDLFFRNMDFPGSEVIADRLAAANPLAQIDEKLDIPPAVQIKLKQQEQTIQKMQQALQAADQEIKTRQGIEQMKQDGATRRTLMQEHGKAHSDEIWAAEERHDTNVKEQTSIHETTMKAISAADIEELKGHFALIIAKMSKADADKENGYDKESQEN